MSDVKYVNWIVVTFKRFDLISFCSSVVIKHTVYVLLDSRVYSLWLEPS